MLDSKSAQAVIINTRSRKIPRLAAISGRGHLLSHCIAGANCNGAEAIVAREIAQSFKRSGGAVAVNADRGSERRDGQVGARRRGEAANVGGAVVALAVEGAEAGEGSALVR